MTVYCKGTPHESEAILDFLNMVFSMHNTPTNFRTLLPKLYGEGKETEVLHYLAKEDGQIKAAVCVLPFSISFKQQTITCSAVGSVAVHPYSRGKGYMRELMVMAAKDMEASHMTLSVLAGHRHRYQYFGYEIGGHLLEFQITADGFKHSRAHYSEYHLSLEEVDGKDTKSLAILTQLYQNIPVHAERSLKDFKEICSSWNNRLYMVMHQKQIAGYLCGCEHTVYELVLADYQHLYTCLKQYYQLIGTDYLTVRVPVYDKQILTEIMGLCERWTIEPEANYKIFNYQKILLFFLSIKASTQRLSEGCLVLEIEDTSAIEGNYKITVNDQTVTVVNTKEPADCTLSATEAISILFSPVGSSFAMIYPDLYQYNWFPLPLSMSKMDKC